MYFTYLFTSMHLISFYVLVCRLLTEKKHAFDRWLYAAPYA